MTDNGQPSEVGVLGRDAVLTAFDEFIRNTPQVLDFLRHKEEQGGGILRLAFLYGMLSEILESVFSAQRKDNVSGATFDDIAPFVVAGRIAVAGSPKRAAELMDLTNPRTVSETDIN